MTLKTAPASIYYFIHRLAPRWGAVDNWPADRPTDWLRNACLNKIFAQSITTAQFFFFPPSFSTSHSTTFTYPLEMAHAIETAFYN